MRRRVNRWCCLLALAAAAGALRGLSPRAEDQGFFTELRLRAAEADRGKKRSEAGPGKLEPILEKRLGIFPGGGGSVRVDGPEFVMRVPGADVADTQLQSLTRIGRLELRHLEDVRTGLNPHGRFLLDVLDIQDISPNARQQIRFRDSRTNGLVSTGEFLKRCPLIVDSGDLEPDSARRLGSGLLSSVQFRFNRRGSDRLERFTSRPGRLMAIVLDGEIVGMNAVAQKIARPKKPDETRELEQLEITGGFRVPEEADYLAVVLNSGPLPTPLRVVSKKVLGK